MMFLFPMMYLPADYNLPPTLYSIMNSIVNFNRVDKVKIHDLPIYARSEIFDFTYPLTENINKEDFEVLILKHFMMRRIGYETMTAFKIALDSKLNEIMPMYNKLFDMLDGWDLLNSGEVVSREVHDGRTTLSSNNTIGSNSNTTTSDRRYSALPENNLEDVANGDYVTDYNLDTNTSTDSISSSIAGTINDTGNLRETINRSPADKIRIYREFIENRESIYTMLFKDLDSLFYGLVR